MMAVLNPVIPSAFISRRSSVQRKNFPSLLPMVIFVAVQWFSVCYRLKDFKKIAQYVIICYHTFLILNFGIILDFQKSCSDTAGGSCISYLPC